VGEIKERRGRRKRGELPKRQKNGKGNLKSTPPPSKKISFSFWVSQRQTAI